MEVVSATQQLALTSEAHIVSACSCRDSRSGLLCAVQQDLMFGWQGHVEEDDLDSDLSRLIPTGRSQTRSKSSRVC